MKLKMYLRMLLAAVAALFVATACDDSEEKTEPVGPGVDDTPLTFEIAVSNIEGAKASLSVTPSNQLATYYWSAVKKSIFDDLGTDEAFLEDDMAFIQREATANQMTLSAYLQWVTGRGTATYTLTGLEAETEYYAYVYGMKTDGTVTTGVTKVLFVSGEGGGDEPGPGPGNGPEVNFSLVPGDPDGANTNTTVTMSIKAPNGDVVSGKYVIGEKSSIEAAINTAGSAEALVKSRGNDLKADWISSINDKGLGLYSDACKPGTEYMAIVLLANADGETVKSDSCSTTGTAGTGPEGSVALTAGNAGANTDTYMTVTVKLTGDKQVASVLYFFTETSKVEGFLGQGITYEKMGDAGNELPASFVTKLNSNKTVSFGFKGLDPETSYTCVVKLTDAEGNSSYYHNAAATTDGNGGGGEDDGLKALVEMIAGHYSSGALIETQTTVTVIFGVENGTAASGKYVVAPTASVQKVLDSGASYEQIVDANGEDFLADEIAEVNDGGTGWYYPKLTPGTSYTAIVKFSDADSKSSVAYASVSTEASGEASDAYKAWLGTWTVTSASSELTNAPLTFDITIDQKVAGTSYTMGGMCTALWRTDPAKYSAFYPVANFISESGRLTVLNQLITSGEDEDGAYDYLYNVRYKAADDGKIYVADQIGLIGLVGELAANGESGQINGYELKNSSGTEIGTVTSMDYFYWYEEAIYGTTCADEFSVSGRINYPIGPYTLVKKAQTGAPALRKAAAKIGAQKCLKQGLNEQRAVRVAAAALGHGRMFLSERIFAKDIEAVRRSNALFEGVAAREVEAAELCQGKFAVAVKSAACKAVVRSARNE